MYKNKFSIIINKFFFLNILMPVKKIVKELKKILSLYIEKKYLIHKLPLNPKNFLFLYFQEK